MHTQRPMAFGEVITEALSSMEEAPVAGPSKSQTEADRLVERLRAKQRINLEEIAADKSATAAEKQKRTASRPAVPAAAQPPAAGSAKDVPRSAKTAIRVLGANEPPRLPYWPEHRRGVSNDMARSALFTVGQGRERVQFKGHRVRTLKNVDLIYTGEELRQRDEDVLLQLLHFGRLAHIDDPISFVAADMLQQLGWTINSRSYRELAESIGRMQASSIHLVRRSGEAEIRFGGSLIRSFEYQTKGDKGAAQWIVTFEKRIICFFSPTSYTQIEWQQRLSLSVLTKWLHTFYFTHQKPFPMKVDTIRDLCGSTTKNLSKFRQALRASLTELEEVGFLKKWDISKGSDLVEVIRHFEPAVMEIQLAAASPDDADATNFLVA